MISVDKRLAKYIVSYYKKNVMFDIPENMEVYMTGTYREDLEKNAMKIFGNTDCLPNYETEAMYMFSEEENKHYILINGSGQPDPQNICVLYHELSHIHTMPDADLDMLQKTDSENGTHSMDGYLYWQEFLADYYGIKTFINTYGKVDEICNRKKLAETCIKRLGGEEAKDIESLVCFFLLSSNPDILSMEGKEKIPHHTVSAFADLIDYSKYYIKNGINDKTYKKLGEFISKL